MPQKEITETVQVTRPVDSRIADLVRFARRVDHRAGKMTDEELVAEAREFWDEQHGED